MAFAEAEHKKLQKSAYKTKTPVKVDTPVWFDKKIQDENLTKEEEEELKDLLKEFS